MSTFQDALLHFPVTAEQVVRGVFVNATQLVKESVVDGSAITGAPGQPVDTGNLRNSFVDQFTSPVTWELSTNVEYAPVVEDNARGVPFRNHGPHSVKQTVAGWDRIVEAAIHE